MNAAAVINGAAFVFAHSDIGWSLENKFEGTSGSTRFGQSVAIDSDRIAVGAPSDANSGYESGAISTYRFAGEWYRDAVIRNSSGAPQNRIGSTLSLSNGRLLVGIRPEQNLNGSVTMYLDSPSGWQRQGISYSGTTGYVRGDAAFIGAPFMNSGATNSGGAEFYCGPVIATATEFQIVATLILARKQTRTMTEFLIHVSHSIPMSTGTAQLTRRICQWSSCRLEIAWVALKMSQKMAWLIPPI